MQTVANQREGLKVVTEFLSSDNSLLMSVVIMAAPAILNKDG